MNFHSIKIGVGAVLRLEKRDVRNMNCYCCKRTGLVLNRIGFWHAKLAQKLVLCNDCATMLSCELSIYAKNNRGSVKDLTAPIPKGGNVYDKTGGS